MYLTDTSNSPRGDIAGVNLLFNAANEFHGGVTRLIELNLQTLKTSLSEHYALGSTAFAPQSVDETVDVQTQLLPAAFQKQSAYWRHAMDIATDTQRGLVDAFAQYAQTLSSALTDRAALSASVTAADAPRVIAGAGIEAGIEAAAGFENEAAPVKLVDSSGNEVSSDDPPDALH